MLRENKSRGMTIVAMQGISTKKFPEIHEIGFDHLNADLFSEMKASSSKLK